MCSNEFVFFDLNTRKRISSGHDLVNIMNIGIQLYSSLCQFARQLYLTQMELPTMLNAFEAHYELDYSDSFSGTVHQETVEGYQYCTSLQRAFKSLISDGYTNFILTVGFIGVAIYCNGSLGFQIFHSHARDLCSRGHPQGTCVLLEIPSLISLVHFSEYT